MARRFRSRGVRRQVDWESWVPITQETVVAVGSNVSIVLHTPDDILQVDNKPTLVRLLGDVWVRGTAAGASLLSLAIVLREVSAAGTAAAFNASDELDRNRGGILWMGSMHGDLADAVSTRIRVDSKAMRKVNERSRLDLIIRAQQEAAVVWVSGRTLWKLS